MAWRPRDEEVKAEYRWRVLQSKEGASQERLVRHQEASEEAAKEISHSTRMEGEKAV